MLAADPLHLLSWGLHGSDMDSICPADPKNGLRSGEFRGQVNTLNSRMFLKSFLKIFGSVAGCIIPLRNTVAMKGGVGGTWYLPIFTHELRKLTVHFLHTISYPWTDAKKIIRVIHINCQWY